MSWPSTCIKFIWLLAWALVASSLSPASSALAQSVESALMPGKVIAGHAKYELECKYCHVRFDKAAQTRLCMDCHKDVAQDVQSHRGFHGRIKEAECRGCHGEHRGREALIVELIKEKFDHAQSDFGLRGKHQEAKCESCHKGETVKYREAPVDCVACHRKDDQQKGHKGSLGERCSQCHDENSWKDTTFEHGKTRFPLGGKHADVQCKACHNDKTFKAARECNSCHKKNDQEKGHRGRYGVKCESCHTDRGWNELRFNHDADTHYVLGGRHRQAKCDSCHLPERGTLAQYKPPIKCVACHKKDDQNAGHQGSLGDKCQTCHNEKGWRNTSFDHDLKTEFPLRDKHKSTRCDACHKSGATYDQPVSKPAKTCIACHRNDDQNKGHRGRFGDKCETCHDAKDWKQSTFDHTRDTAYRLRDSHTRVKCSGCHLPEKGPLHQAKLATQCVSCHKNDDSHKGQLGNKCESCHNEDKWQGVPFDHAKSRFPLLGTHRSTECKKCHITPAFHDAPSACNACHEKDDVHKRSLGAKCASCHNARSWKSWDFNHNTQTRFKLDGAHRKIDCGGCHRGPLETRFKGAHSCGSCHDGDDVHDGSFGQQCDRCHTTADFRELKIR